MSYNIVKNGQLQDVATHVTISADTNNAIKTGTDGGLFAEKGGSDYKKFSTYADYEAHESEVAEGQVFYIDEDERDFGGGGSGGNVEIVTAWESTLSDEKVPSEKLVKESIPVVDSSLNDTSTNAIQNKAVNSALSQKASTTLVYNALGTSSGYSSTKTYNAGDYCISNNKLWECLATCSGVTPSASETTKWKEVSMASLNSTLPHYPDYSSEQFSSVGAGTYTMTADGYATYTLMGSASTERRLKINGSYVGNSDSVNSTYMTAFNGFVKKGDILITVGGKLTVYNLI